MVVTNIAIIVIMLMIIKQGIEYPKDSCYDQRCFFLLYWLSCITVNRILTAVVKHRKPWPAKHPKVKENQRGVEVTNEDNKITLKI